MAMKTVRSYQTPPLLKLGKEAEHTNKIIQWANVVALLSVAVWLVLVSIIFYISGPITEENPNYQRLSSRSCSVSNTVASFELGAILLRIIHQSNLDGTKWIKKFGNGGFNNGYVIMGMSAITNLWLANFLTPVTTDNITGMTVYPLRWAQWTVSGGALTFMTESLDARHWKVPMLVASSQILSCSCGLIFPFISTLPNVWYATIIFSTACWLVLFPRYYYTTVWIRKRVAKETQKNTFTGRLIITANRLRKILIILWSLIVFNYFLFWSINSSGLLDNITAAESWVYQIYGDHPPSILVYMSSSHNRMEASLFIDTVLDMISKTYFTAIVVGQYETSLDHCKLVEDQFDEMVSELNIIWNHSSDVLIVVMEKENTSSGHYLFDSSSSEDDVDRDSDEIEGCERKRRMKRGTGRGRIDPPLFVVSARASPSLLELTGQASLGNLDLNIDKEGDTDSEYAEQIQHDSGLTTALRKAWTQLNRSIDNETSEQSFRIEFQVQNALKNKGFKKDCELMVNKVIRLDGSITMVAVARDISNRTSSMMLDYEREKNLIARETAHTVKNLNTTAYHKLLELLEDLNLMQIDQKKTEKTIDGTYPSESWTRLQNYEEQLRQTLAIMTTAAQQTYQLSRVGEILKGDKQHLTSRVSDCTLTWRKICGAKHFHADADALALLVDEFRINAIFSNAWSNALAHGDCTRMSETEIILKAKSPNMLEISIINPSQPLELPFDFIDETIMLNQTQKDGFGKSPAAKLTTRMGLSWMRKLCDGRLSIQSEGHGGKTTLKCTIDADFSELVSSALAEYVKKRASTTEDAEHVEDIDNVKSVESVDNLTINTSKDFIKKQRQQGQQQHQKPLGQSLPSPPKSRRSSSPAPSFTSSPNSPSDSLTPFASAHLQVSARSNIRVWDAALSCALLQKYGVTVIDDSRAFAIQMRRGFAKAFNIKKCKTLCGSKTTRYAEVCALLRDHQKVEPALIVLDRNLGHGINTSGERVEMPTGDIVSMRLREKGIDCCLILLTGDSCEQLEQYSRLLKGHFIDLVLDKHHLPSYIYIFEKYTQWLSKKIPLGKLLLGSTKVALLEGMNTTGEEEVNRGNEEKVDKTKMRKENNESQNNEVISIDKVRRVLVLLVESKDKLEAVEKIASIYRGCSPNQFNEPGKRDESLLHNDAKAPRKTQSIDKAKQTQLQRQCDYEKYLDALVSALEEVLPSLLLCQANSLCEIITAILKDPEQAVKNALEEQNVKVHEEVSIGKAGLLIRLARETVLMLPIFDMAIEVLDDSLKECHGVKTFDEKLPSGTGG